MLRVTLMGNMGADPEARYTQKGTQIVSLRVAVNQVRRGPDGERQENTEWFRVSVTGRQTEYVQRLTRGTRVLVMGRLDISHFQSRDGEPRTGFDVWAEEVQAMSTRTNESDGVQDADGEALEATAAGVSSLSGANGARATTSGGRPRSSSRSSTPGTEAGGQDLEDLPF
ncbi:MAG: single-stranded DNA-binding protein [Chloroflexota bacterium]|nr:single-stranded DNA-binding protein [Chloroflexota bacterium]